MQVQTGVPLAPLTTLHLGGSAATLLRCESSDELVDAVRAHPAALILGGGSNVVLPDQGLDEVILVRSLGVDGLTVQAGEDWDSFVASTLADGYAGLEALSGIPGTVGASPIQNIGAYGGELASVIDSVDVFDRTAGEVLRLGAGECGFGYRTSRFKQQPQRWVVLSVTFALSRGTQSSPIGYAELAETLGTSIGQTAPAAEVRQAVLTLRARKGMVVDQVDPDSVSAGSFFTNPVVDTAPAGAPSWPVEGGVKVSAAWLIQQAGFDKGWGQGRIGVSSKHALALVNRGGGTSAELLDVARLIRDAVRDRFGITLANEPLLVGTAL